MQLIPFIVAAAAAFHVAQADFMVYTVPPIPTDQIPKFTDPAEVSSPLPVPRHLGTLLTSTGLGLDPQCPRSRQPRIHILHQLARPNLPILALVRRIRHRSLRTLRIQLHHTACRD